MSEIYNLMFAGVGGQGSLLIAEMTSLAAASAGFDVKQTEVHGVSQRGGSVETHVRFGDTVYSPIVTPGEADVVVSLEKLEALRFAHYVNRDTGILLVNDFEIIPASVAGAEELYPHQAIEHLQSMGLRVITLPASQIARELEDARMANVVLMGALTHFLPIPVETWERTLRLRIPARYLDGNLKAFAQGREILKTRERIEGENYG